jgi:hypothetical protein
MKGKGKVQRGKAKESKESKVQFSFFSFGFVSTRRRATKSHFSP